MHRLLHLIEGSQIEMDRVVARALIHWRSLDEGGRPAPPLGEGPHPYTTVVRFHGDELYPDVAWSLQVHKLETLDELSWNAEVHYLVSEAPHDNLVRGRKFELLEGRRCVAEGVIL